MFFVKLYNGGTEVYHDLFRESVTKEGVRDWCEHMYSNSAYWLHLNLWSAIQKKSNAEFIVPLTDYDGLTGEVEVVHIHYAK